jgi:putative SOS response-associated peptidase YedK
VCVIYSYYEWQKKGSEKLPYFTRFEGGGALMLLAGLYDITMLEGVLLDLQN